MHDSELVQIKAIFHSVGMDVDLDTGELTDGVFSYGFITELEFSAFGGKVYDMDELESVEFDEEKRILRLFLTGDREEEVHGGPPVGSSFSLAEPDAAEEILVRPMPTSILELNDALSEAIPDLGDYLYYDTLMERDMVDLSVFNLGYSIEGASPGVALPLTDKMRSSIYLGIEKRLRECGYTGKQTPKESVMNHVLNIRFDTNRRNPFREWVESQEWDGTPRLRSVFRDYVGAVAPSLRDFDEVVSDDEVMYLDSVCEAWFLGAVARMYKATQHDVVPVFIGLQGLGKGSFLKFMAGKDDWYSMTTEPPNDVLKFLERVRGTVIVELGESTQLRNKKGQDVLKAFISQREDRIRKKYARDGDAYPRHFIMAASANNDAIFVDPTGARRFYPIYCNPDLATKYIPLEDRPPMLQYEVEQIWAEALYLYRQGHKASVSKHVNELARVLQEEASVEMPLVSMINDWLDDPMNGYAEVGAKVYRDLILEEVFGVDPRTAPSHMMQAFMDWVDSTRRWEKCKQFSHRNKTRRGYMRTVAPGVDVEVKTFKLVMGDEPEYNSKLAPLVGTSKARELEEEMKLEEKEKEEMEAVRGTTGAMPKSNSTAWLNVWNAMSREDKVKHAIKVMRSRCRELDLNTSSAFPIYNIRPEVLEILMEEGCIYNLGTNGRPCYMVGAIDL